MTTPNELWRSAPDITMLALDGFIGGAARSIWLSIYGNEDLNRFVTRSEQRHRTWEKRGCSFDLITNWRGTAYVQARCKVHGEPADHTGSCHDCNKL